MTIITADTIIDSFPYSLLDKIEGKPTFETLAALKQHLFQNAASVPSIRGGGANGYLGILQSAAVYATIDGTPFLLPVHPGVLPDVPAGTQLRQREQMLRTHTELLREW